MASSKFILSVDPQAPPPDLAGAVVAIGNFDGVHRGHRAVICRARALAKKLGRPCAVLTFEPHPADFFAGVPTIFRLTSRDAKAHRLRELGLNGMFVLSFDAALAGLDAEGFLKDILLRRLGATGVVVGYDFHFGAKRFGDAGFLAATRRRTRPDRRNRRKSQRPTRKGLWKPCPRRRRARP